MSKAIRIYYHFKPRGITQYLIKPRRTCYNFHQGIDKVVKAVDASEHQIVRILAVGCEEGAMCIHLAA